MGLASVLWVDGVATAAPPRPLNVLFIVADDLNTTIGCYGGNILTPHIDAFARLYPNFKGDSLVMQAEPEASVVKLKKPRTPQTALF